MSYRTDNNYVATSDFFNPSNEIAFDGVDNNAFSDPFGMLSAPQSTVVGGGGLDGNGVYKTGAALAMPNETFNASNYWVDVTFHPTDGLLLLLKLVIVSSAVLSKMFRPGERSIS